MSLLSEESPNKPFLNPLGCIIRTHKKVGFGRLGFNPKPGTL